MAERPELEDVAESPGFVDPYRDKTPERLFHAAPVSEHDSIVQGGLDPARYPKERWDPRDLGVWCFDTFERARDFAESRSALDWEPDYEVWEIDTRGLEPTRPGYDPEGPIPMASVDVWYFAGAVPAERVQPARPEPALELG